LLRSSSETVTLTESELLVARGFTPNDLLRFPLRYTYQNRGAESARELVVTAFYEDENGYKQSRAGAWHVR
jgi:hypothetical protein